MKSTTNQFTPSYFLSCVRVLKRSRFCPLAKFIFFDVHTVRNAFNLTHTTINQFTPWYFLLCYYDSESVIFIGQIEIDLGKLILVVTCPTGMRLKKLISNTAICPIVVGFRLAILGFSFCILIIILTS